MLETRWSSVISNGFVPVIVGGDWLDADSISAPDVSVAFVTWFDLAVSAATISSSLAIWSCVSCSAAC